MCFSIFYGRLLIENYWH